MKIKKIFSFLVPAGKHIESLQALKGTEVLLSGKLYEMLNDIFIKSDHECNIPIYFKPAENKQNNDVRTELIKLIKNNTDTNAVEIAKRLYRVTTNKSGLGLLFIIIGKENDADKIVISRFPADQGITAEENTDSLTVKFIEKVFMKNANAYKSVLYKGNSIDSDFWEGMAIDRQISNGIRELSEYWIKGFLQSDFKTTPKEGTRLMAVAMKTALSKTDNIDIKQQIVSSAVLAMNFNDKAISIDDYCKNLSEDAKELIYQQLPNKELATTRFVFDVDEFQKHTVYKSIELDHGGTLIAPSSDFNKCFIQTKVDNELNRYRFETEGVIKNVGIRNKN